MTDPFKIILTYTLITVYYTYKLKRSIPYEK